MANHKSSARFVHWNAISRAHWAPNSTCRCMSCHKQFRPLVRRRHHCRFCGSLVCGKCSTLASGDAVSTIHSSLGRSCSLSSLDSRFSGSSFGPLEQNTSAHALGLHDGLSLGVRALRSPEQELDDCDPKLLSPSPILHSTKDSSSSASISAYGMSNSNSAARAEWALATGLVHHMKQEQLTSDQSMKPSIPVSPYYNTAPHSSKRRRQFSAIRRSGSTSSAEPVRSERPLLCLSCDQTIERAWTESCTQTDTNNSQTERVHVPNPRVVSEQAWLLSKPLDFQSADSPLPFDDALHHPHHDGSGAHNGRSTPPNRPNVTAYSPIAKASGTVRLPVASPGADPTPAQQFQQSLGIVAPDSKALELSLLPTTIEVPAIGTSTPSKPAATQSIAHSDSGRASSVLAAFLLPPPGVGNGEAGGGGCDDEPSTPVAPAAPPTSAPSEDSTATSVDSWSAATTTSRGGRPVPTTPVRVRSNQSVRSESQPVMKSTCSSSSLERLSKQPSRHLHQRSSGYPIAYPPRYPATSPMHRSNQVDIRLKPAQTFGTSKTPSPSAPVKCLNCARFFMPRAAQTPVPRRSQLPSNWVNNCGAHLGQEDEGSSNDHRSTLSDDAVLRGTSGCNPPENFSSGTNQQQPQQQVQLGVVDGTCLDEGGRAFEGPVGLELDMDLIDTLSNRSVRATPSPMSAATTSATTPDCVRQGSCAVADRSQIQSKVTTIPSTKTNRAHFCSIDCEASYMVKRRLSSAQSDLQRRGDLHERSSYAAFWSGAVTHDLPTDFQAPDLTHPTTIRVRQPVGTVLSFH